MLDGEPGNSAQYFIQISIVTWTIRREKDNYISGKNQQFMDNLFEKTVDCVESAIKNMKKGNLYYGYTDISEYMRDARDPISFDSNMHRLRFVPNDGSKEVAESIVT